MAGSKPDKATIVFSKTADYKQSPVTGAWGGVSPQKEIIVDFYVDQRSMPHSSEIEAVDGKIVNETRTPNPQPIERAFQFGAVMRPDIARSIGEFLIAKADEVFEEAGE